MPGDSGATHRQDHILKVPCATWAHTCGPDEPGCRSRGICASADGRCALASFSCWRCWARARSALYIWYVARCGVVVRGLWSRARQARKRDTGEVVAVKKISKEQFDASNKDRVIREKKVLETAADNPWLVGLSYAFQVRRRTCAVVERTSDCGSATGQRVPVSGNGVRAWRRCARSVDQHWLPGRDHGSILSRGDDCGGKLQHVSAAAPLYVCVG